jgi:hypothetical protein
MTARIIPITSMPTREGRLRYPHTKGFFPDLSSAVLEPDPSLPCRCKEACHARCGGECGCVACNLQFVVWADEMGYLGHQNPLFTEAQQLKLFRDEP